MAVPKKRTTKAARGQRRAHDKLQPPQLITAKNGQTVPRRLYRAASLGLTKRKRG